MFFCLLENLDSPQRHFQICQSTECNALRNLVLFVQFKKREMHAMTCLEVYRVQSTKIPKEKRVSI